MLFLAIAVQITLRCGCRSTPNKTLYSNDCILVTDQGLPQTSWLGQGVTLSWSPP